ncbi:MAG: hypothetical protein OEZ34_14420, partial [Spirochaetia bacterium]|nr:hypothetical protein [Spirochaetia bacterium]
MLQKITFTTFTVSLIFLFLPVFYGRSFCESRLEGILQSGDYYSADPSGSRICFFSGYENQIEFTIINPSDASFSLYIFKYEKNKYIETVYPGKNLFQFEVNQPGLHAFEFYSEDLKEDFIIQSETTAEFKIFLILVYSA